MAERWRATGRVILVTVGMPLLVVAIGFWQWSRSSTDELQLERQRAELTRAVHWLDAGGAPDRLTFRHNGQLYGGPLAASMVRNSLGEVETGLGVAKVRGALPPLVVAAGGLAALLAALVLVGATLLGWSGSRSRERLVNGFSFLRQAMPAVLGALVLLPAISAMLAAVSEVLALAENHDYSNGTIKVLLFAVTVAGGSLWTAVRSVRQLRGTLGFFTPEPLTILGRTVTAEEAPGLWRTLDRLATRLNALRPENVVVGLQGGFFVSSGPKKLQPGGTILDGRTLYVPLPQLALVTPEEVAAIIGHELAHFSGADTEYSLRFLPIYAGVDRALRAVLMGGRREGGTVSLLIRPALRLGGFVIERFHHAVRHWSRLREFAADAAGASATSSDAMAGALLRIEAADRLIADTLGAAFKTPDEAPSNLVAATLSRAMGGLHDPSAELNKSQPHPTDTHPPTIQRLRALHRAPDPAALAAAAAPPPPNALADLGRVLTDPAGLCRAVTSDFLDQARRSALASRRSLQQAAAAVPGEERALHVDARGTGLGLMGVGLTATVFAALLWFGLPMMAGPLAGMAAALGLGTIGWGAWFVARTVPPFLLLRPEAMHLPGLDRPIAWADVMDLDMLVDRGRVTTRVLLPLGAPFPERLPGGGFWQARRVRLDAADRIVTFTSGMPRGMNPRAFAALIAQYRTADAARRKLSSAAPVSIAKD